MERYYNETASILESAAKKEGSLRSLVYNNRLQAEDVGEGSESNQISNDEFGKRFLSDKNEVFEHNAWDNVDWPEEKEEEARQIIEMQMRSPVAVDKAKHLIDSPGDNWDHFYATHTNRFFMDRNWVSREFSEIFQEGLSNVKILDVGCGVGNTTFPLLEANESLYKKQRDFFIYSCDLSSTAINMLRDNPQYSVERCHAFVWDITQSTDQISPNSLDFILCVYVLSALVPEKQKQAIANLIDLLKPGGMLMVKDYSRNDLTQLRFKSGRFISDNFYCRGDGTLVYFFTLEELHELFGESGLVKIQSFVDKRLIVNRAKRVKMYRRWIQCKYVKDDKGAQPASG